jgi:hypothetical protein
MLLNNPLTSTSSSSSMHVKVINVSDKKTSKELEDVHSRKNHHIITLYYRDGCPPCDKMKPEWKRACEMFKQKYQCKDKNAKERTIIASVDSKGVNYLNNVFHNIQGTPTMLYISDNNMSEYNGEDRRAENLLKWFEESLKSEIVPLNNTSHNNVSKRRHRKNRRIDGGCWDMKKNKKTRKSRGGRKRKYTRRLQS